MKKIIILIVLCFIYILSCKKADDSLSLDEQIEHVAKSHMVYGRTPGIAIGTYHDGIESNYFYGTKNLSTGEKIDELTVFEIGSITKTFTALLFADFVVKNQISLNDTIDGYFPANIHVPSKDGVHIKFLNLLNHTSGLPREPNDLPAEQPVADFDEIALTNYFIGLQLNATPGTNYEYSNLGMGLAGYLLGRKAGKDYNELLKENIFVPIGMIYTACNATSIVTNNIAQGYYGNTKAEFYIWSDIFAPSGTILSNLHDMMIYLKENINSDNSSFKDALILTRNKTYKVNDHLYIGLGWHLTLDGDGYEIFWHNGGTRGFSSFIAYNNSTKDGVVILINSYCYQEQDIIGIEILNLLNRY
jgi:CubicO group peptidase (beta-lactamase class C family)